PPMRGGLKIIFADRLGNDSDFIWMRGSGTEPVFRIMADASGNDRSRHDYLLAWQRSLVESADREAFSGQ
ncbi:MAG: phosphoglucomutase, partial [Sphaerochaetaceae bacterium]|nr:phosphoglucomutase [Sphaerochaetaceae bacterium]